MSELPAGWIETTLGEIADTIRGVTYKKAEAESESGDGRVPLLRATNIVYGRLVLDSELVYVPSSRVSDAQLLSVGDIVIAASSGSRAVVGKSAPLTHEWSGTFGAFCCVARPRSVIDGSYLAHFVGSETVRRRWSRLATGTNINNLKREHFTETPVPVPPVNEQRRIVAAIEKHLSRLDAAGASLAAAIRRLDALVGLAYGSAFDGGEAMPIGELGDVVTGSTPPTSRPEFWGDGVPFATPSDLAPGRSIGRAERHITSAGAKRARLLPSRSVLVTCIGATIGKTSIALMPCATNQQINAVVVEVDRVLPEFLLASLASPSGQRLIIDASASTTMPILNKSKFKALTIRVPSLEEQRRIVAEIEERLGAIDALRAAIERAQRKGAALRRVILERAFSGELVPQDPSDEPASALLDRIRAERAAIAVRPVGR